MLIFLSGGGATALLRRRCVVVNWVFNNARGSVLIVMLLPAANNAVSGNFCSPMFTGADSARQSWLLLVWAVAAVLVIGIAGPEHFSRKYRKQTEPPPARSSKDEQRLQTLTPGSVAKGKE